MKAKILADIVPKPSDPNPAKSFEMELLNRKELAGVLKCSLRKIDHLQAMGMPCLFVGRSRRYIFAEVVAWLKRKGGRR